MTASPEQLGFGFDAMLEEQEAAHLPAAMDEAIAHYRGMIEHHHQAMLAGDEKTVMEIRKDATRLAVKLNNGEAGIFGGPDAPGYVLERGTAAPAGTVPMWGQTGEFTVTIGAMTVRIQMEGMLGVRGSISLWPGFSANAVEPDKPFFSETGYRSFLDGHAEMAPGMTPDVFAREVIAAHIKGECKGRLRPVKGEYRGRS
jgi:hypothetical protein